MAGLHITDHQTRLYMTYRQTLTVEAAAAKTGFSTVIDRLIHHATILEMNVESYRRKAALDRKRGPGRPPAHSTQKELEKAAD